jgi:hypothetical protein
MFSDLVARQEGDHGYGTGRPRIDSLPDHTAFELGEGTGDLKPFADAADPRETQEDGVRSP